MRKRLLILLPLLCALALSCGDAGDPLNADAWFSEAQTAAVTGQIYRFDTTWSMLEGAEVSLLERPYTPTTVISDENGLFTFDGLAPDDEVTFLSRHPDFFPTQTATLRPGARGLDDVTIQQPPKVIVWAMALFLLRPLDPNACQIAATVTEPGANPWSQGIEGVQVSIDPPLEPSQGPFYFKIIEIPGWPILDLPLPWLTETTGDGGLVYINVPPGEYVLTAHKEGMEFTPAHIKCRPGVLVNASPPYGLTLVENIQQQ